jgi:hypothetical protein
VRDDVKHVIGLWPAPALLGPSLVWLALDRSVWPWDQAWFGAHTVSLYETLRGDLPGWPSALVHTTPSKPPAVAWIGQFFVPVGMAFGSVDAGLLLSIWLTHVIALIVVYCALVALSGGRTLAALAGTLSVGAAPLFVGLSTQYLAEAAQTLAVAWFAWIMVNAERCSRSKLAAHLLAAASFAMLAKATSPAYCAIPAAVATAHLARRRAPERERDGAATWRPWILAAPLAVMAIGWYAVNHEAVLHHARTAAFGPVAELYGRRESLARGFVEWCAMAWTVFLMRPVALLVAAFTVFGAARRVGGRSSPPAGWSDLAAAAAFLQLTVTLGVFALSPVREPRYLVPLLPLVSVVVCWALVRQGEWPARLVIGALAIQLVLVHTQVLGLWPARPPVLAADVGMAPALHVVHRDGGPAHDLAAIVRRTCPPGSSDVYSFVGVDLLELSGHALTYAAAKERLAGRAGRCRYDSIAFGSVESAEAEVKARTYRYWIAVDPEVRPIPAYHGFLNQSAPVLFRRLRRRGVLEEDPWNGPRGVLLYRFVTR